MSTLRRIMAALLPVRDRPPHEPTPPARGAGEPLVPPGTAAHQQPHAALVQEAFWIVLGRAVEEAELREQLRALEAGQNAMPIEERLVSSAEFHLIHTSWTQGLDTGRDRAAQEAGLRGLGPDRDFVVRAFELLLGRTPDPDGRSYFLGVLAGGETRLGLVRTLVISDEFADRYRRIAPDAGFVPRDVQLCELANPAKWDNPDWMRFLRELQVLPTHKVSMHRKSWEFTQLLFGMERLGRLHDEVSVLSVGAGHEAVLFWLANHVRAVMATDLYEGRWQTRGAMEGDGRVVRRPEDYAPFPYRRERLRFLPMDGRRLAFAGGSFDVVYSLSSIEHFGGFSGARASLEEMARVLAPGGLLAVATEQIVSGPSHEEAFQPEEVRALIELPGLRLVQPIDGDVYRRYDFRPVDVEKNPHQTPHMAVRIGETVFTSVMVFMEKET
jgi:SAM-dependent methyltransferase